MRAVLHTRCGATQSVDVPFPPPEHHLVALRMRIASIEEPIPLNHDIRRFSFADCVHDPRQGRHYDSKHCCVAHYHEEP